MQPQILGPTEWWKVETTDGTCWVQCEDVGRKDIKAVDLLDHLPEHIHNTRDIMRWEFFSGFGARLSTLEDHDCTDWTCFDTKKEAHDYLAEGNELCPLCLQGLDESGDCARCISALTWEETHAGLEAALEGVSASELITLVPNIYSDVAEDYNNSALHNAYQQKVTDYQT